MNHNRKRREAEAREQRLREAALKNAVLVDRSALDLSHCGLGAPAFLERGCYVDYPFICVSCGSEEVWTASRQKWWYEVAKGSLHSGAKLCRTCRRDARSHKGEAHPLQNIRRWLGLIRDEIEPALLAAGWRPVAGAGESRPESLSYDRDDVLARLRWEYPSYRAVLILERRDDFDAPFRAVVSIEVSTHDMTREELQRRFDGFLTTARRVLLEIQARSASE